MRLFARPVGACAEITVAKSDDGFCLPVLPRALRSTGPALSDMTLQAPDKQGGKEEVLELGGGAAPSLSRRQ